MHSIFIPGALLLSAILLSAGLHPGTQPSVQPAYPVIRNPLLSAICQPAPADPNQSTPTIRNQPASTAQNQQVPTIQNQPAPAVKKLRAADLQAYIAQCDHPLIVSFWATWCQPCIKEIPYFQKTVEKHKEEGVELLLVSLDPPGAYPARIAAWAQKNGYTASLAWLNETDPAHCSPTIDKKWSGGLPSSLFVNSKTHYRQFFDRQLTDLQVEPAIKAMLAP